MTSDSSTTGLSRLAGRKILVTGAASGMGEGIARLFAREGAKVALLDIAGEAVKAIASEIGGFAQQVDVSSEDSVKQGVQASADALGGLDGVVNAAGILVRKPLEETDIATFQRIIGVNLLGPFLICREALPHLRKAPSATIVNIASLAGLQGFPGMGIYSASKGGLVRFTEALSGEVGPTIRVNCICPGVIRTPMTDWMWEDGAEQQIASTLPVGRIGEPEDIANTALFLSTPDSAFINTVTIRVDGGRYR